MHAQVKDSLFAVVLLLVPLLVLAQKQDPVSPSMLKPHLQFLASDELQGRETGEHGQKIAALYMATIFERLGLKGGADDGTFFQKFPLYRNTLGPENVIVIASKSDKRTIKDYGRSFYYPIIGTDTVEAPVVFAGYGIDDTAKYGYSDYIGMDVKGKGVLILDGVPGASNPASRFYQQETRWHAQQSGLSFAKLSAARRAGVGLLILIFEGDAGELAQRAERVHRFMHRGLSLARGSPSRSLVPTVVVSREVANELLKSSGKTVKALKEQLDRALVPVSFEVPDTRISSISDIRSEAVMTENVIARIEGTDPKLKEEVIVFSAHYDHLGMSEDSTIYNGADDDGSGTATLLALAEAFSRGPKPKRSLLFVGFTGEEKGLLGSSYYVSQPVVDLKKTFANLNIDMIGRSDTAHERRGVTHYTYVIGSDKISKDLDDVLQRQNKKTVKLELDYTYNDESDPNMFYRRSDHYNFARNGVPVIFFFTGVHADYHQPTDDVEKIDFPRMAKVASLIFAVGRDLANRTSPLRPLQSEK